MRKQIPALLILVANLLVGPCLCAQNKPTFDKSSAGKGVAPVSISPGATARVAPATRAVIVGISDYQDEDIPDLRFADKDAEAFSTWLSSPAGGALPATSVKTLLNAQATTGKIIAALDGLISASKAGDLAIIYFSGHGDVERVTKFQRGYWLTYDSPPTVYAAGAFSLVFLQDIITTLAEAGVQVVVVSDACRAGKLAGSEYGGAQATTAALSKQFANEIKILSCQPNEFSLEGEQWGGGRGAFSYHLLDALYGLADQDVDDRVTVKELGRYLEDHVAAETAPHRQNPLVLGDREMQLAAVIPEALAQWRQQKTGDALALKKIDPRGFEDMMLAGADSSIRALYAVFTAALERGDLMPTDSTVGKSANDYYELLIKEPALADLHGLMTRNFAAALMDEGQQVLNRYLKGNLKDIEIMESQVGISYRQVADKFYRAAELLGERHYYYSTLKAKGYYYEAYASYDLNISGDSAMMLDIKFTRQALALDPNAPYLLLNLANMLPIDSINFYLERLNELAPNWAFWHYVVADRFRWENRFDKAVVYFHNAIRLDPTYLAPHIKIAQIYETLNESGKAVFHRETAIQLGYAKIAKDSATLAAQEWYILAEAFRLMHRYTEAEWAVLQAEKLYPNVFAWYDISFFVFADVGKYEMSKARIFKWIDRDYKSFAFWLGRLYFIMGDYPKAEASYKIALADGRSPEYSLNDNRMSLAMLYKKNGSITQALTLLESITDQHNLKGVDFELAELQRQLGKMTEADSSFRLYLSRSLRSFNTTTGLQGNDFCRQIITLHRLGKWADLEKAIESAEMASSGNPWYLFIMSCFYAQTGQPDRALRQLKLAETAGWYPNPILWLYGTVKDPFLDPLRQLPEFQAWEKRWSPPYKDYSKN